MLEGYNVYSFAFLAAIVMLAILLWFNQNQNITHYLMMYVAIIVANMGYYTVSTAQSMETALMGHRLTYLGGVFVPVFMLFSTMKLCRMEVPKWLSVFLVLTGTVVLYLAFTVGHKDIYYKSVSLGTEHGMTVMLKEYGPMHTFYNIYLYVLR